VAQASEKTTKPQSAADWHQQGNSLVDEGKLDRAISAFRRALRMDDGLAEVHNDLGAAYFQKGWHAEAEECFRKSIALRPEHGVAHANLGAALRAQGRLNESRRAFQRALALRVRAFLPRFLRWRVGEAPTAKTAEAARDERLRAELAKVAELLAGKRHAEALELALGLERSHPGEPDVLLMCAMAFEEAKDVPAALERARRAIELKPDRAEYHIALTRLLVKASEHNAALDAALKALKLEPGSAEIHATIAGVCHPWRNDLAEQAGRRAIELDPASHAGHGNLSAALWGLGRLEEAEPHAREALRLKPSQIAYRSNLALILKDQGRLDEARGMYRQLLAEAPDHPKIAVDLGTLAMECDGDVRAARGWYRKAQALAGEPRATLSEALIDLAEGNYAEGWERYEARKQVNDQRYQHGLFAHLPEWRGDSPPPGRLLVYGEQGLGDEIMFASLFSDLARHVAGAGVVCDARLGALFRRSLPDFEVIAAPRAAQEQRARELQGYGAAIAAGSLGRLFRRSREAFPDHRGYLRADEAKTAEWKRRIDAAGPGLKVGLSWIGGLQKTGRSRRSLSLERLRPMMQTPGTTWVSLQYTNASAEIAASGLPIAEFPGIADDLDELAAVISALDLVISVCNTTVHVAGAVGKEVLVMAPFVPEWRYGLAGERMVWYPSARVFRQPRYGSWDEVLATVAAELAARTL
jgi:tetratricopeptide (TPR) repeat protein